MNSPAPSMFGLLAVIKPCQMTSRSVVNQVEKHLRLQTKRRIKVGHSGTLDPFADGLMILGIGRATSLLSLLQKGTKRYVGEFELGQTSASLDLESDRESVSLPENLNEQNIKSILPRFRGSILQVPPRHSAIRIGGKRAYDMARAGKAFEVPPRNVMVHDLQLQKFDHPKMTLSVECGGGTYIRTLGDDIAQALGTRAVMTRLTRTASCGISIDQAFKLESLLSQPLTESQLLSPRQALAHLDSMTIQDHELQRLSDGLFTYSLQEKLNQHPGARPTIKSPLALLWQNQLVALVYWRNRSDTDDGKWKLLVNLTRVIQADCCD